MKLLVLSKSRAATAAAAALAAVAAASLPVQAATSTATVNVSASVASQCNVQTATLNMGFGLVDVLATGTAVANPLLTIQCNKGATVGITANSGLNAVGTQKQMKNTANTDVLAYSILQPTGLGSFSTCPATKLAGTELTATSSLDVSSLWTSNGGPRDVTLCGLLETPQVNATPGTYEDTVLVTVTY